MNFKFAHFNFNVMNIENSKKFYDEALGLKEFHRIEDPAGEYLIVYLQDGKTGFELELTELKSHPQKYDLGKARDVKARLRGTVFLEKFCQNH